MSDVTAPAKVFGTLAVNLLLCGGDGSCVWIVSEYYSESHKGIKIELCFEATGPCYDMSGILRMPSSYGSQISSKFSGAGFLDSSGK